MPFKSINDYIEDKRIQERNAHYMRFIGYCESCGSELWDWEDSEPKKAGKCKLCEKEMCSHCKKGHGELGHWPCYREDLVLITKHKIIDYNQGAIMLDGGSIIPGPGYDSELPEGL